MPEIIFLDAWHTLFTVREHGPRRTAIALDKLGVSADEGSVIAALKMSGDRMRKLDLPFVATPELEREYFRTHYRFVLEELAVQDGERLVDELMETASYVPYTVLYDDTLPALDGLRARGQRVGLLSNAFPSLLDALDHMGILGYFDPLVISAFEGCEKPDPAIYRAAVRAASVEPSEAIFVDDLPENVEAANSVGMRGILVDRDYLHPDTLLRRIAALTELLTC
ncbi:MAG: HAD-IA family hydrolase [Anaerolineae bacterium]